MQFRATKDGQPIVVVCNIVTGDVTLSAVPDSPVSGFLKKMHMNYKSGPNAPWYLSAWHLMAISVASALCFWVVTGFAMWYQMKSLRWSGIVVLALTMVLLVAVLREHWQQYSP
ncbi:MAG: hypothetical protein PSU94_17640 [Lacunisphaera sp.]|nr:hypothetical protein [Lacunisphaera sp.]